MIQQLLYKPERVLTFIMRIDCLLALFTALNGTQSHDAERQQTVRRHKATPRIYCLER